MEKHFKIEDLKIALIYGKSNVDESNKDGNLELIAKDTYDTAHYFYMKEFLKNHFIDQPSIQNIISKHDINSIFFEIQKLGHIAFAENTSVDTYHSGLLYIPKSITANQKETLKQFQKQLGKENYNITVLFNLFRSEEGIIMGNQLTSNCNILDNFIENTDNDNKKISNSDNER